MTWYSKAVCRVLVVCAKKLKPSFLERRAFWVRHDWTSFDTLNSIVQLRVNELRARLQTVIVKCAKAVDIWRRRRLAAEMHYIWIRPCRNGAHGLSNGLRLVTLPGRGRSTGCSSDRRTGTAANKIVRIEASIANWQTRGRTLYRAPADRPSRIYLQHKVNKDHVTTSSTLRHVWMILFIILTILSLVLSSLLIHSICIYIYIWVCWNLHLTRKYFII